MALSFLNNIVSGEWGNDDILKGLNKGKGIAQGVFDLLNIFNPPKSEGRNPVEEAYADALRVATSQRPTQAEQQANALYQALLDPNNSLVRQHQQEGTRLGVEGLLTQIRALTNSDRRRTARGGRGSLVDPERRDEFLDYSLSRGLPFIEQQALTDARTNIGNQAAGLRGLAAPQVARQAFARDAMLTDAARRVQMGGKPYTETYYPEYQNKIMSGLDRADNIFSGIDKLLKTLKGPSANTQVYGPVR